MHVNVIVKENKEKSTVCNEHKVLFFFSFLAHCHPQGYPIWLRSDWRSSECYVGNFEFYKILSGKFCISTHIVN